jgi:hypothetical protein
LKRMTMQNISTQEVETLEVSNLSRPMLSDFSTKLERLESDALTVKQITQSQI